MADSLAETQRIDSVLLLMEQRLNELTANILPDLEIILDSVPLFPSDSITALGNAAGDLIERHPEVAIQLCIELISAESPPVRAFAVAVISRLSRFHPAIWKDIIRHALTDQSWEIRQLAAHAFDSTATQEGAAEFHFDFILDLVGDWAKHSDYLVRYAASQALLGHAARKPEIGQRIFGAIDPLFNDPSEHVRTGALGAMRVIGKRRPDLVLSFIELKLDTLGEFERDVYRNALNEPFALKNALWREKLLNALTLSHET